MTRLMPSSAAVFAASPAWLDLKSSSAGWLLAAKKQTNKEGVLTQQNKENTHKPGQKPQVKLFLWLKKHHVLQTNMRNWQEKEVFLTETLTIYMQKKIFTVLLSTLSLSSLHIYNCTYTSILHPSKQRAHTPEKSSKSYHRHHHHHHLFGPSS